jgi:hypothetical protein
MPKKPQPLFHKILIVIGSTVVIVVFSPLILLVLLIYFLHRTIVYTGVWLFWLPRGKDVLFVYSDSTIWREYMLAEVLPLVKERAVVLNWSERNKWRKWSFKVRVFNTIGGDNAYNPLVVLFRPFDTQVFRFWPAFNEWKRGNTAPLNALVRELRMRL